MLALLPTLNRLLVLTLFSALSACGMFSKTPERTQKNQTVSELRYWQAKGKLSVIYQNKANSAYFEWDNRDRDFTIHLHGPLGQGSVYLRKVNDRFTLEDGDNKYSEKSAEDLLYSQLGLQFPVSDLIYWIRGIRAPGAKRLTLLPSSSTLYQKGWKIDYPRRKVHEGYLLPEKLVASRKEIKLTMIIKRWDITE